MMNANFLYIKGERKISKTIPLEKILACLFFLTNALVTVGKLNRNLDFVSIGTNISLIISTVLGIKEILNKLPYRKHTRKIIVWLVMVVVFSLLAYLVNPTGNLYDALVSIIALINYPICLVWLIGIKHSRGSDFCAILSFFIMTMSIIVTYYNSNGLIYNSLLGYSNSNLASIYMLMSLMGLMVLFVKQNRMLKKLVLLLVVIVVYMQIVKTDSRNSIFIAILLGIYVIFLKNKKPSRWIVLIFILIPIIILWLYLYVQKTGILDNVILFNKPIISGREIIYELALQNLRYNWLFGNFAWMNLSNAHNGYLSVLATVGVFGFVSYMFLLYSSYEYVRLYNTAQSRDSSVNIALLCLLLVLLHASFEAVFLIGGASFGTTIATILYISQIRRSK